MNDDAQALMSRIASLRAQLANTATVQKPQLQLSHAGRRRPPASLPTQKPGTFRNRSLVLTPIETPIAPPVVEPSVVEPILTYSASFAAQTESPKRKHASVANARKRRKISSLSLSKSKKAMRTKNSQQSNLSASFFQRQLVRLGDADYSRHVAPSGNRSLVVSRPAPPNSALFIRTDRSLRLATPKATSALKPVATTTPTPVPATADSPTSLVARARVIVQQATKSQHASAGVAAASHIVRDFRQPCMFFVRFGECKLGAKCRFAHPRDKVAVCRAFLRGECAVGADRCKLSHAVAPEKMPTCRHFLKGRCAKGSSCEYRHVRVADDAPVCDEFLKGWCPLGLQCAKHHTYECVSFARDGKCERGDACRLLHIVDADDDAAAAPTTAITQTSASPSSPPSSSVLSPKKKKKTTTKKKRKVASDAPAKRHAVDIVDSSSTAPILIALRNSFAEDDVESLDGSVGEAQTISFRRRAED